jgi:hypothetical protein
VVPDSGTTQTKQAKITRQMNFTRPGSETPVSRIPGPHLKNILHGKARESRFSARLSPIGVPPIQIKTIASSTIDVHTVLSTNQSGCQTSGHLIAGVHYVPLSYSIIQSLCWTGNRRAKEQVSHILLQAFRRFLACRGM